MAQVTLVGPDREAVGTVSIAGPAARLTPERMKEFALHLKVSEIADLWLARKVANFVSGHRSKRESVR
jgi:IclR family acetate operon transcriptional repressor